MSLDPSVGARAVVPVMVWALASLILYQTALLLLTRRTDLVASTLNGLSPILGDSAARMTVILGISASFALILLVPLAISGRARVRRARVLSAALSVRSPWLSIACCLLVWPLVQLISSIAALVAGTAGTTERWVEAGAIAAAVATVDPILVNSGPEEIVSRALVLALAFELLRRRMPPASALAAAFGLSLVSFAIGHIPIAIIDGRDVVSTLLGTPIGGVVYGLLFVITRNVYLVAVVQGVGNASIMEGFFVLDGVSVGEPLIYAVLFVAGLIAAIPLWLARRRAERHPAAL